VLANELRKRLDALLETKIERPDADISSSPVVEAILRLINTDGI
jgi:ATP-dependent RNA helicase DHX57